MAAARALLLVAAALGMAGRGCAAGRTFAEEVEALKTDLLTLPPHEARRRLEAAKALGAKGPPSHPKIEHFVVLLMENRGFDHFFGCMLGDHPEVDGIPSAGHLIPVDPSDPSKGTVNATEGCGNASYVCKGEYGFGLYDGHFDANVSRGSAAESTFPYGPQSDSNSFAHGAHWGGETLRMFSGEQLPVKRQLAASFGVFNKYFTSVPSSSTPNHLFTQSATSCGIATNIMYSSCGGKTDTFPQMTIYDSLYVNNVSFALFMNSTCGANASEPGLDGQPCHSVDPNTPAAGAPVQVPDVAMSGVGRYKRFFKSQEVFYTQAAAGTLPHFSWLMPRFIACDHPCQDVAQGEVSYRCFLDRVHACR